MLINEDSSFWQRHSWVQGVLHHCRRQEPESWFAQLQCFCGTRGVKKWKFHSDWNLICFCLREQWRQKALHRSSLRLGFSPGGFICIQRGSERANCAASFHFFWLCFMVRICPVSRVPAGMQVGQRAHTHTCPQRHTLPPAKSPWEFVACT